jgi:hypothetical protein
MRLRRFLWVTALANAGVAAAYGWVGAFAANFDSFLLAFLGSLALPGAAMMVARFSRGRTN